MTARDTGEAALAALALTEEYQHLPPQPAMRALFLDNSGDATAAARDLGVGKKSLMAALASLGLDVWLAERWPNRAKGGQGARLGRKVQP